MQKIELNRAQFAYQEVLLWGWWRRACVPPGRRACILNEAASPAAWGTRSPRICPASATRATAVAAGAADFWSRISSAWCQLLRTPAALLNTITQGLTSPSDSRFHTGSARQAGNPGTPVGAQLSKRARRGGGERRALPGRPSSSYPWNAFGSLACFVVVPLPRSWKVRRLSGESRDGPRPARRRRRGRWIQARLRLGPRSGWQLPVWMHLQASLIFHGRRVQTWICSLLLPPRVRAGALGSEPIFLPIVSLSMNYINGINWESRPPSRGRYFPRNRDLSIRRFSQLFILWCHERISIAGVRRRLFAIFACVCECAGSVGLCALALGPERGFQGASQPAGD